MRLLLSLTFLVSLSFSLACGGGSSSRTPATGNLTIRFGTDSFAGYSQAVVSLEKVEGSTDGATWTLLGNVKTTVDLMALQKATAP